MERVAPSQDWQWPTGAPAPVLEGFNPPSQPWGVGHRGVDLALAAGSPVLAAGAGTVVFAGSVAGRPVISIDHAGGIRTTYEPVEPVVAAGDQVTAGQVIGVLVAGHRSDGVDALHWGARTGRRTYINPLRLLQPAVIRLKPLNERPLHRSRALYPMS
ncbi:M23 family metallopeptidase [Actinomyces respiraculi]|uniref:M23 family metallopeptidase n=1 Tax=Actinomyces respiraculi TaxID=2744574 RepID=UPI0018E0720D|nr:M23 family metallopeptidase [Actinomyces respiraculi]